MIAICNAMLLWFSLLFLALACRFVFRGDYGSAARGMCASAIFFGAYLL